jgi:hypothetical protein
VNYDGFEEATGKLLEAKGERYAYLFAQKFGQGVMNTVRKEIVRQLLARGGRQIVWHVAEAGAVPVFEQLVAEMGGTGIIEVVLSPLL